jgi:hypothetical protein
MRLRKISEGHAYAQKKFIRSKLRSRAEKAELFAESAAVGNKSV